MVAHKTRDLRIGLLRSTSFVEILPFYNYRPSVLKVSFMIFVLFVSLTF